MEQSDESQARTARWRRWDMTFWQGVYAALESDEQSGAMRCFGDVYVGRDFVSDDGVIQVSVIDAALAANRKMSGLSIRFFWDSHSPESVVKRVLEMVAQVRADPIFRIYERVELQDALGD